MVSMTTFRNYLQNKNISTSGIFIIAVFIVFTIVSAVSIRWNYLESSRIAGKEIAEKIYLQITNDLLKTSQSAKYISYQLSDTIKKEQLDVNNNQHKQQLEALIKEYHEILYESLNNYNSIECYVAIGPHIVSDEPKEGDDKIDATTRPWYQKAVANIGKVVLTEPYHDIHTNSATFTLSVSFDGLNVFAIDFFLDLYNVHFGIEEALLGNYSYFLIDGEGDILTYKSNNKITIDEAQSFACDVLKTIKEDQRKTEFLEVPVKDEDGKYINFYYYYDSNYNLYCIVSLPYDAVIAPFKNILLSLIFIVILFFMVEFFVLFREKSLKDRIKKANKALTVLSNSYRVVVRVNCKSGKFSLLTATDYFKENLNGKTDYNDFLNTLKTLMKPKDYEELYQKFSKEALQKLLRGQTIDLGYDFLVTSTLTHKLNWYNVRVLYDISSKLEHDDVILAFKDIHIEKLRTKREKELLMDSLHTISENEKTKNQFFSCVSHDMRTPLNGILGLCLLAKSQNKEEKAFIHDINKIEKATNSLLNLINDLLDIARNNTETCVNKEPLELEKSMRICLSEYQEIAKEQQKTLEFSFNLTHKVVLADKKILCKILRNLLSNALKFTKASDTISIRCTEDKSISITPYYTLTVKDNGIGISKDYLKHIFTPYVKEERTKSSDGSGLGMPIVKNLVDKLEGHIEIDSEVDKGTTIKVTIPLEISNEDPVEPNFDNLQSIDTTINSEHKDNSIVTGNCTNTEVVDLITNNTSDNKETIDPNFSLQDLSILLCEDNHLNMEIASELLEMEGCKVTKAFDGKEGYETFINAKEYSFDVILMDMKMPNMDGITATKAIRSSNKEDAKTIPIIALTANAQKDDILNTKKAGMNAHITKPIDFKILKDTLSVLIKR